MKAKDAHQQIFGLILCFENQTDVFIENTGNLICHLWILVVFLFLLKKRIKTVPDRFNILSKAVDLNHFTLHYKSHLMGKPTICIGENKDADQLRGNREADQRLCFRYSYSTIPLLLKSEISSF